MPGMGDAAAVVTTRVWTGLCPGEGSIGRYRKWTRQFYAPSIQVSGSKNEPAQLEGLETTDATAF